ncbi:MAG: TauD/TfdA dioxygenase family protein [Lautropia sp.]
MKIEPGSGPLGACVSEVDLGRPLSGRDFGRILAALGEYGVLRFPAQGIEAAALKAFSGRFGALQVLNLGKTEPGMPEVSILSNIVKDGRPIGVPDAGQDWHTDMTYNPVVGFVNVLVAQAVPMRDGRPLGATEFANTQKAYEDLPAELKERLATATATHDLCRFAELMRRKGSQRPPISPELRSRHPPARHPVFLTHPITGRKVIFVNPGFVVRIDGLPAPESERLLEQLYSHVLSPKYRHRHHWTVGDVLVWDHIGTWHNAVADYRPDEYRLMKRCQVMADRIFDPAFVQAALH